MVGPGAARDRGNLDAPPGVEVTREMVAAGLEELNQHRFGEDWEYLLECVYRAMFYEREAASETSDSK